jgi:hypothetical protein
LKIIGYKESDFEKLVFSTVTKSGMDAWANDRHIWMCSKLLSRPIYVYSKFNSEEMVDNSQKLKRMFMRTRQDLRHVNYTFNVVPLCTTPLRIFYTPVGQGIVDDHFVALLPRTIETIEFVPKVMPSRNYRDWNGLPQQTM